MENLKKTIVPVGSAATPIPDFDDRKFVSPYEAIVWETKVDAERDAIEQSMVRRTMRMPAVRLNAERAKCRSSVYWLLAEGFKIEDSTTHFAPPAEQAVHSDSAPTLRLPIVEVASSQWRLPSRRVAAFTVAAAVIIAFVSGLVAGPRLVATAKRCYPACTFPSTCNAQTGRCEGKAASYVDAVDMDQARNGIDEKSR